jgi:2-succinyl-5-enolpyruvyl-6-hydroxy-3-cyclohexene-1-carboxylate synthase
MTVTDNFPSTASNINQLWASLIIEELIRHGVTDFCIAPGSRSTPLTLAAANHLKAKTHVHFDERGLGFLALGISQSSQKPVVVITTSGTAVANLYPAIIEAKQSSIPLIIISADRPLALIDCGANQAIEQQSIFANYPVFSSQLAQPSTEIVANYLLTTIDHGLNKQQNHLGPIHFNVPFAEPLYPTSKTVDFQHYLSSLKKWPENNLPFTQFIKTEKMSLAPSSFLEGKKVIVIMAKIKSRKQQQAIVAFTQKYHNILFTDIQSSQCAATNSLSYYDLSINNEHFKYLLTQADIIVQFGEQLLSKGLNSLIEHFDGELHIVHPGDTRIDPNHQVDVRYNCDAMQWINAQNIPASTMKSAWFTQVHQCHSDLAEHVIKPFLAQQPYSEMMVIDRLDQLLAKQQGHQLVNNNPFFIGNSMPIRLADMFMNNNQCQIFTNRGSSGIDGLLASAVGIAKQSQNITTLLIGDNSFLYDLNSLALLKQLNKPFIIIVINNDGGAIFNHLPVPKEQKEAFYQMPHGLNFKASCQQFGIDYHNPNQISDFETTYNLCLEGKHSLIEVNFENQQNVIQLAQLKEHIKYATK